MNIQAIIIAKTNDRQVYRRVLSGYQSLAGLEIAIAGSVNHAFKNYSCEVVRF